jgi:amino acid transporter
MSEGLRREFSLRDLILFHITAIVTVRWISLAAARGPSSIGLWALSFFLFFLPIAYVVVDFSRKMPEEGGLYQWTKHTIGPFHGFLCAWAYVVNNLFYFPSLLVAVAGYLAFMMRGDNQALQNNKSFIIIFALSAIWLILILNYIGLRWGKWVQNIGGLSIWLPCSLLIIFGLVQLFRHGSATTFTLKNIFPDFKVLDTWSAWANICFAFTGIELASTMSGEIKNPERNLPRSIYYAGFIITCIYGLGTLSVMIFLGPGKINLVTGIMQAIGLIFDNLGLSSLTPAVSGLLVLGGLGTLGAWLAGAARIPYTVGLDNYLPKSLGKLHPRFGSPYVSLLILGIISSIFLVLSLAGSSVQQAYLVLSNAALILYFIPFVYLFVSHLAHNRRTMHKMIGYLLAAAGLISTVIAIVLACIPPPGTNAVVYELECVGGSAAFLLVSLGFFFRGRKAKQS